MRRKILILTVVAMTSVGVDLLAQPQGGGGRRGGGPPGAIAMADVAEKLDLTAEQKQAWDAIREELERSTASTRARMRELRDQGAGPDDEEVVKGRETMRTAFDKAESDLLDLLTDEQKAQYKALKKKAASERGGGAGRGGMGRHRGGGGH